MRTSFVKTQLFLALGIAGLMCAAGKLQAAEIQGVTIASASGSYTNLPDFESANQLVSNVGLFGDYHTPVLFQDMWWSYATNTPITTPPPVGTNSVVFNLGGLYTVNAMKVWNYNANNANTTTATVKTGIKTGYIFYSPDGVNWTTNIASQAFNEAPGTFSQFAQIIDMSPITAQYIGIGVVTNWGSTNGVGLSKVRFISDTNPPTVVSAFENFGSNQVTMHFSESMDPNSATNMANYSIAGSPTSPTITSVAPGPFQDQVILYTTPLTNNNYTVSVSGVYDELLTATVTNNSAVPVQPELYLWLMANNGVQTNANGIITQWTDQSGYGHNAVPPFSLYPTTTGEYNTSPPAILPNIINGLPAMSFVTNVLTVPNDPNNPLNGDETIFMVEEKTSAANANGFAMTKAGCYTSSASNLYGAPFDFYINTAAKPTYLVGNGGGNGVQANAVAMNQFYLLTLSVKDGTNGTIYTNGAVDGTPVTTGVAPVEDWGSPFYLGMRPNLSTSATYGYTAAANFFVGYIPEYMVIHGTLTPSDQYSINQYFGTKYGLPVVTQEITEEPASVTAQVGYTAAFWVNVKGLQPSSYQWYSNNVSIAGATAAVYTTPALTMAANGTQYYVKLTGGAGLVSTPATLTVVPNTTPPLVFSATKTPGLTNVVVEYSESVGIPTGTNAANYTLSGGASVLSGTYGSGSNQVILTTTALSTNAIYTLSVSNVQDLAGNTIVGTTVPLMPSGLVLWLRADQGVVTNANAVNPSGMDEWLDQSPQANNALGYVFSQGNTGYRPTLGTDAEYNNVPSALFDNANYLSVAASSSLAITNSITICTLLNAASYNAYNIILGKTTGPTPDPNPYEAYLGNTGNGNGNLHYLSGNGAYISAATAPAAATGTLHLRTITQSGTNISFYLDGVLDSSSLYLTTNTDGGEPLLIGSRSTLDLFMNGDIPVIMIFSNTISSADQTNINNYLGGTYFPLAVTQAPTNFSTEAGDMATFSVGANQGGAILTYQWVENGTNITGATSPTYTTGTLFPGDNDDTFSVVVGTLYASTNVGPAILTVSNNPPTIISAGEPVWSTNSIVIIFSLPVSPATATDLSNYSINGVTLLSAAIGTSPNEVVLTTSTLTQGTSYQLTVQNLQNMYGATMPSPIVFSTGIYPPATALWLKANTGVTTDGSGNVSQWDDLSGNYNNMMGVGVPYDPQLATNAYTGQPVIRFTGTNETLMYANDSSSLEITGNMSVFVVVDYATLVGNTNGEIVSKVDNNNESAPYDYYASSSTVSLYRGNGSTSKSVNSTKLPSVGVPHLLDAVMQGTTVTHRLDGNANGSGTLSTTIADQGQQVFIGTRQDGTNRLTGDMAELIVVGSALSTNDVASMENYLAGEYGLAIGVPPINPNPTNIVFSVTNNQLYLSWPADHIGWTLQAQTNSVSVGIGTNWANYNPSTTTTNQVAIPINLTNGTVFYRLIYTP